MLKVGKYLFKADDVLLASKAMRFLGRRQNAAPSGTVVVDGVTIAYELVEQSTTQPATRSEKVTLSEAAVA